MPQRKKVRKETFELGNMLRKSQKLVYLIFPSWANVLLNGKNLTTTVKLDACNILSSARTERMQASVHAKVSGSQGSA